MLLHDDTPRPVQGVTRRHWLQRVATCSGTAIAGLLGSLGARCEPPAAHLAHAALSPWTASDLAARLGRLDGGVWLLQCHEGDADARNRGWVSNLLIVPQGSRLWILGSGPSPVFGAALSSLCESQWPGLQRLVISPWAHPESVLGLSGLPHAQHIAQAEVAEQMAHRCPGCLERLAHRLGGASTDLGHSPIRLPQHTLAGASGTLGPFAWDRLLRAADVAVTVWRHQPSGLVFAPGLLWGDAPPDARDGTLEHLQAANQALVQDPRWRTSSRWIGQQGAEVGAAVPAQAAAYWIGLERQAERGMAEGDDGFQPPRAMTGVPSAWLHHAQHELNWQRAWRQVESRWLQRSLR